MLGDDDDDDDGGGGGGNKADDEGDLFKGKYVEFTGSWRHSVNCTNCVAVKIRLPEHIAHIT